jgi:hypothetical protein
MDLVNIPLIKEVHAVIADVGYVEKDTVGYLVLDS